MCIYHLSFLFLFKIMESQFLTFYLCWPHSPEGAEQYHTGAEVSSPCARRRLPSEARGLRKDGCASFVFCHLCLLRKPFPILPDLPRESLLEQLCPPW